MFVVEPDLIVGPHELAGGDRGREAPRDTGVAQDPIGRGADLGRVDKLAGSDAVGEGDQLVLGASQQLLESGVIAAMPWW